MDPSEKHSFRLNQEDHEREITMVKTDRRFDGLSFVQPDKSGYDMWAVTASGDWSADNATGRQHALALIGYMKVHNAPQLLGHVVRSMTEHQKFGGVEVGFFTEIASRVCSAP